MRTCRAMSMPALARRWHDAQSAASPARDECCATRCGEDGRRHVNTTDEERSSLAALEARADVLFSASPY